MRQDAWDGFKLAFFQSFRLAWYATRDTVSAWIFVLTRGRVNPGAQLKSTNPGPERAQPYQHAMAHRTGTRALDIRYDRPWWRRFIDRDFG